MRLALFFTLAAGLLCSACGTMWVEATERTCSDERTWEDSSSGYTWHNPASIPFDDWVGAVLYCDGLKCDGQSDWRLPSAIELRSLIRGCESTELSGNCHAGGICTIQPCDCAGCDVGEGLGNNGCYWPTSLLGRCSSYWSSTRLEKSLYTGFNDSLAWYVEFGAGAVLADDRGVTHNVRCVRTGP